MAVPETARRAATSAVFESITQTDSSGRYRLENITPGRYHIAAGPVGLLTFHPGTTTQSAATIVEVTRNVPLTSGVDFTLSTPNALQGLLPTPPATGPAAAIIGAMNGGLVCCRFLGTLKLEDGRPLPDAFQLKVYDRRGNSTGVVYSSGRQIRWDIPINTTVEVAMDGLPAGYVLKSVEYGGQDIGLNPFLVDGKSRATLDLTIGYEPVSTLKKVSARGRVVNSAPASKVTTIRFTSTLPNGPALDARLQPDGSFEILEIPVGAYQTGVVDATGGANVSQNFFIIRDNVSGLTIDLQNNPFPEFDGPRPERNVFTGGKTTEITGVITQRLAPIGKSDAVYFRLNVKDAATGVVTPWAVFVEHDWQVPRIIVGETITVPGVPSTDGTNRFSASPF
jgi:hypothetical protein